MKISGHNVISGPISNDDVSGKKENVFSVIYSGKVKKKIGRIAFIFSCTVTEQVILAGNILCVFVFSRSKLDLKPAFSNILKCLSVFDTIFLVSL